MSRRKRKEYSPQDRENYIAQWEAEGRPPKGTYARANDLTPSMFTRWLQLAGKVPVPPGGVTGGTPRHLLTVAQQAKTRGQNAKNRKVEVEVIRKALYDRFGPPGMSAVEVAQRYGCHPSSVAYWKKTRPGLMPGGTSVVSGAAPLFDAQSGRNGQPQSPPPALPEGELQLRLGNDQEAASGLFEQNQDDAWSELMTQLEPLPPRNRLRVLTLIDKIQT